MKVNGTEITKNELLKRCGSLSQIASIKRCCYSEGRAKGLEYIDVNNGSGLRFNVLIDRNMDIFNCEYKGINLAYISQNPITSSAIYSRGEEDGWLRSFNGGLLTTCGITSAGAACVDEGEKLGIHGRIGSYPCENICIEACWDNEDYILMAKGNNYETRFFGENLSLKREIIVKAGENKICIVDTIENLGFKSYPIMMIYHMNFGFPLLDNGSQIYINSSKCIPTSYDSEVNLERKYTVELPKPNVKENVYFHLIDTSQSQGLATLFNNNLCEHGLGVYVKFDKDNLPFLNQWNMMTEGEYVVGLEPSNCMTLGRDLERKNGSLRYIEPGEIKNFVIEIGIIEGRKELDNIINNKE